MHVLVEDRVSKPARAHMRKLLAGDELIWDQPPMAQEPWGVYAAVCSAMAQIVRLFGKEIEFDQWGEQRRLSWVSMSWDPLPYDFAWNIICRPFGGVTFSREPDEMPTLLKLRYLASWTHGHLSNEELQRFIPLLREVVIATILQSQGPEGRWERQELEGLMLEAHNLKKNIFMDLYGFGDDSDDTAMWLTRRALMLLRAAQRASAMNRDLFALGY